jgi:hypothetical protein
MTEDEAFWTQVRRRDSAAFEKLYCAHFGGVRNFLGSS